MGKYCYCRNQRISYWQFLLLVVFCLIASENMDCYNKHLMLNSIKENLNNKPNEKGKDENSLEVKGKGYISKCNKEGLIVSDERQKFIEDFSKHISKFKGETVTIFVTAGGEAGDGFTGVLIDCNNDFTTLISIISFSEGCIRDCLGAIVDIPIDKITAFAHNTV